jgi:type II secretion system protein N
MKKWLAYLLYIVGVTIFFLYYLFPGVAFTSYINYRINGLLPGYKLLTEQAAPSFPPGLKLKLPALYNQNKPIIGADQLKIRPAYLSLLSDNKTFFIDGFAYDGPLEGSADIIFSLSPQLNLNLAFKDIQISQIQSLREFVSYEITGAARGNIFYNNGEANAVKGNAEIIVSDSSIKFNPSLFGIDQLSFKIIEAEFEMINRRITLNQFEINGRQLSGDAKGTINLTHPINKSRINITGAIKPHPTLIKEVGSLFGKKMKNGGIPFRISGTLERPDFSLK